MLWPGIVKQSNLDAKAANAVPALGVLVAVGLTIVAAWRLPRPDRPARLSGDTLRIVVAVATLALALPWVGADWGVSFNGVPVLGSIYQSSELRHDPGSTALHPAVHHGHHHGMDGALLMLAAILLSRRVPFVARRRLRIVLAAYLSLLFTYGAGNVANDFWLEQIVKRGWTTWQISNVTTPAVSVAWAVVVASALVLFLLSSGTMHGASRLATRKGRET